MRYQEILSDLGVPFVVEGHEHCRPGWVQLDCPYCSPRSQHWRLGLSLSGGYVHCWACGHHPIVEALAEITDRPYREIKALLGGAAKEAPRDLPRRGKLVVPPGVSPLSPAHRSHLSGRGFRAQEIADLWGVKGIGIASSLQWRLWIPITLNWEVVSWTTRALGENQLRYISASPQQEAVNHKHLLYGEEYCRYAVIVHEGPTDVWATGPGAVATLGMGFHRKQVLRLAKYPTRVICFDNEPDAQRRAKELCRQLMAFPGETYNVVLSGKDAASSPEEEIRELRSRFLYAIQA